MLVIELVVVLIFCFPILFLDRIAKRFAIHQKINAASVRSAHFLGEQSGERALTPPETTKLIALYNQLIFIQKRDKPLYEQSRAAIVIELTSNERIHIQLSDEDIDVQRIRSKNTVTFWARQDELRTWLMRNMESSELAH